MPKSGSDRVAEHRRRQQAAGMISVTVVLPKEDVRFFREMAAAARHKKQRRREAYRRVAPAAPKFMAARQLKLAERWAAASGLKLRLTKPGLKLAEVLARNIAHQIVRDGWSVGRNLGSARELQARYGVGRNLLREAIRQLESQSIARMQRGAVGGLIVVEPSLEAAAYMSGVYLEFRRINRTHLQQMRRGVQLLVLEHCMDALDDRGRAGLREALAAEQRLDRRAGTHDFQRLHVLMAQLTGNPALELSMDLVLRLYRYHYRAHAADKPAVASTMRRLHRDIVNAMLADHRDAARHATIRHLHYVDQWLEDSFHPRARTAR